ncbi:MAG: methylenetetrahydrofolate reductase [Sphingomicrobium sp.]
MNLATASVPDAPFARSILDDPSIEITANDEARIEQLRFSLPSRTEVAITFLPRETLDGRVRAARRVRENGFIPVPHLSARRIGSVCELDRFLGSLVDQAQVDRVFVVGGDIGMPAGPYGDALAVIQSGLLESHGIRRVGIAGYPDGHPQISQADLEAALHDKLAVLRASDCQSWITTQFGFDAVPIASWLDRLRGQGIHVPVRIGVAGPAKVKSLLSFAARCGVGVSARVMAKYGLSLTQLLGSAGPVPLIEDLGQQLDPVRQGEVKLHVYPFGGIEKTASWMADSLAG